jgi:hypothetical protein
MNVTGDGLLISCVLILLFGGHLFVSDLLLGFGIICAIVLSVLAVIAVYSLCAWPFKRLFSPLPPRAREQGNDW